MEPVDFKADFPTIRLLVARAGYAIGPRGLNLASAPELPKVLQSLKQDMVALKEVVSGGHFPEKALLAIGNMDSILDEFTQLLRQLETTANTLVESKQLLQDCLAYGQDMNNLMLDRILRDRQLTKEKANENWMFDWDESLEATPTDIVQGHDRSPELRFNVEGKPYRLDLHLLKVCKYILLPDRHCIVKVGSWSESISFRPTALSVVMEKVIMAKTRTDSTDFPRQPIQFGFGGVDYKVDFAAREMKLCILLPDVHGTVLGVPSWFDQFVVQPAKLAVVGMLGKVIVATEG